jgi:ribose/xylose/arabinose/galactoside ABC-type transport system permease subunit
MKRVGAIFNFGQSGLLIIIIALGALLTLKAGHHVDRLTGHDVNNFLNVGTLIQVATDTSFFAIMAVGMTTVIVSGGIDLSIGSIFALCEVMTALMLRAMPHAGALQQVLTGIGLCCGIGLLCGLLNGLMVSTLQVHPFIITLGTMWVYRGIAFVATKAESILVPDSLTAVAKANLGLRSDLYPLPMLVMIVVAILGYLYLQKTTLGRRVFAVGGNIQAARYAGLKIGHILTGVYVLSGLTAGIAAFVGSSFYGSASSGDANGYELYVIAGAVVGGASLIGGKGSAIGALFGALLIVMIRQAIRNLGLDQNYEWIIIGVAIVVAVVLDRFNSTLAQKRLVRAKG